MSTQILERGRLTDALVTYLQGSLSLSSAGILIGDGVTPEAAGWVGGTPDVGTFVPSVTIETGEAIVRDRDTVRSRHASWLCNYGLVSAGGARNQCDATADRVRATMDGLRGATVANLWTITDVVFVRLSPVTPNKATTPPSWEMRDSVQLWVDRKRS